MRGFLLLTLVVLLFIVLLHTAKGYYDTEDIDLFYKMPYRRAPTTPKKTPTTPKKPPTTPKKPIKPPTTTPKPHQYIAVYPKLENYQVEAKKTTEAAYPYVARVIHSRTRDIPHVCTAILIEKAIFITAARCILSLKVEFTSVKLLNNRYPAKAFALPSKPTRQYHEDIGFIVVEDSKAPKDEKWKSIKMDYDKEKRTDKEFMWFSSYLERKKGVYIVVGYAAKKHHHNIREPGLPVYDLCQLDIKVGHDFWQKLIPGSNVVGFQVPSYMPCTFDQYKLNMENSKVGKLKHPQCKRHHGVEGGAVINTATQPNKLVGVATWGAYTKSYSDNHNEELPVGFAIPNSDNFVKDYECAKKIRNSPKASNYEKVCK